MSLDRFIKAQENIYNIVLEELSSGVKKNHYMWYIFPQIKGLGSSYNAMFFALESKEEAKLYLENELLSSRLNEVCELVLKFDKEIYELFPYPDNLKLFSSMTLFHLIDKNNLRFKQILDKFYGGKLDSATIEIINTINKDKTYFK